MSPPAPEWVHVTPDQARKWLAQNTHNRPLRERTVAAYAADMAAGNWLPNGETIKFAIDGTLLDGQHRIAAAIESGVAVWMLVVRGLPNDAQETLDVGLRRTFSDVLKLRGEVSWVTLAAIVRSVAAWESGERGARHNVPLTHAQLSETLHKYPWLRDGATVVSRANRAAKLPTTAGGVLWWLTMQIDTEDAEAFFARLISPEDHHSGEPIWELRKHLLASAKVRGERPTKLLLAVSIKAWNKFRQGEPVGVLYYRIGGANPEKFPMPV